MATLSIQLINATYVDYDLTKHIAEHDGQNLKVRVRDGLTYREIAKYPAKQIASWHIK